MKKITIFIGFLFFISSIFAQVEKTSLPSWVEKISYNQNPSIDEASLESGVVTLLFDQQINETNKHFFYRYVTKITENVGVQSGSSINVLYDPSYENLEFHSIDIIRDGKTIDKLKTYDFQVIRRELNSESYIYDGSLSALSNLSDIRLGDIIDYSYSLKGANPIHKGNFSTSFYLNNTQPLGKLNVKLISKKNLKFKYVNTDLEFITSKKGNDKVYKITKENIPSLEYDITSPSWKPQFSSVFVSNYNSWQEIVDWGVDVFNVNKSLSKELNTKIDEINKNSKNSEEKITATLNFVQDEIRYLGLESGIGAYEPFSSNKVFKQRYGDCKDKSLLMVTMLNKMGIEAYPMLVNTYLKQTINDVLPSPKMFDHCVVKVIDESAGVLWYDPTIANQGGTYDKKAFPDYRYGLVLKKGNTELDQIYSLSDNDFEITDTYELEEVGNGATLKTKIVYYDDQADALRNYFLNNSIKTIKKQYESLYAEYYYNIKATELPKYTDDREKNVFTTYQEYEIDSIWQPSLNDNQIATSFYPYSVINSLNMPAKRERELPFAINYPLSRTHKINIKLPQKWNILNDRFSINSANIFYEFDVKYKPSQDLISLNYFLKVKKDHVTIEEFPEYYENLKKIDTNIAFSLLIPKDEGGLIFMNINSSNTLNYLGIFLLLFIFLASIWFAVKVYAYDPEPVIESYFEENKKIDGWLILIGIILCFSPFGILFDLLTNQAAFLNGSWIQILNSNSDFYNFPLGVVVFFELIVNILLLVFTFLFIILFFKKRSSFPKLYAYGLIGFTIFLVLDIFLVKAFSKININFFESPLILISLIRTGIVSAYLLISDNVKETFVKRLK